VLNWDINLQSHRNFKNPAYKSHMYVRKMESTPLHEKIACETKERFCIKCGITVPHKSFRVNLILVSICSADHSGRAVYGMNYLRPHKHWGRGFKSHSRHGCLFAFILFVFSCVGSGLATG
jgi:hypothetical protein